MLRIASAVSAIFWLRSASRRDACWISGRRSPAVTAPGPRSLAAICSCRVKSCWCNPCICVLFELRISCTCDCCAGVRLADLRSIRNGEPPPCMPIALWPMPPPGIAMPPHWAEAACVIRGWAQRRPKAAATASLLRVMNLHSVVELSVPQGRNLPAKVSRRSLFRWWTASLKRPSPLWLRGSLKPSKSSSRQFEGLGYAAKTADLGRGGDCRRHASPCLGHHSAPRYAQGSDGRGPVPERSVPLDLQAPALARDHHSRRDHPHRHRSRTEKRVDPDEGRKDRGRRRKRA